jgi:hypothetical protein
MSYTAAPSVRGVQRRDDRAKRVQHALWLIERSHDSSQIARGDSSRSAPRSPGRACRWGRGAAGGACPFPRYARARATSSSISGRTRRPRCHGVRVAFRATNRLRHQGNSLHSTRNASRQRWGRVFAAASRRTFLLLACVSRADVGDSRHRGAQRRATGFTGLAVPVAPSRAQSSPTSPGSRRARACRWDRGVARGHVGNRAFTRRRDAVVDLGPDRDAQRAAVSRFPQPAHPVRQQRRHGRLKCERGNPA